MSKYNLDDFHKALDGGTICVLDVETTLIERGKSVFCEPPRYLVGETLMYTLFPGRKTKCFCSTDVYKLRDTLASTNPDIVVGHNLPFDLKLLNDPLGLARASRPTIFNTNCIYWDTSVAAYMMSGQTHKFPSLEKSLVDVGLGHLSKDSEVSEAIKAGTCPSTLHSNILERYLHQDVLITKELFNKQVEILNDRRDKSFFNLVLQHMQWRYITFRMSMNGLNLDRAGAVTKKASLEKKSNELAGDLCDFMCLTLPEKYDKRITPNSNQQVKLCILGGKAEQTRYVPTGTFYKSGSREGKERLKKEVSEVDIHCMPTKMGCTLERSTNVNEEALEEISTMLVEAHDIQFISDLLEYRKINKDLKTYYTGYVDKASSDDLFHPEYRHTVTPTGRISCAYPNLMNLPKH